MKLHFFSNFRALSKDKEIDDDDEYHHLVKSELKAGIGGQRAQAALETWIDRKTYGDGLDRTQFLNSGQYFCCGEAFSHFKNLNHHIKLVHDDAPAKEIINPKKFFKVAKSPKIFPKPDAKKPGPPEARKGQARLKPGTSLLIKNQQNTVG